MCAINVANKSTCVNLLTLLTSTSFPNTNYTYFSIYSHSPKYFNSHSISGLSMRFWTVTMARYYVNSRKHVKFLWYLFLKYLQCYFLSTKTHSSDTFPLQSTQISRQHYRCWFFPFPNSKFESSTQKCLSLLPYFQQYYKLDSPLLTTLIFL